MRVNKEIKGTNVMRIEGDMRRPLERRYVLNRGTTEETARRAAVRIAEELGKGGKSVSAFVEEKGAITMVAHRLNMRVGLGLGQ